MHVLNPKHVNFLHDLANTMYLGSPQLSAHINAKQLLQDIILQNLLWNTCMLAFLSWDDTRVTYVPLELAYARAPSDDKL